MRWLPSGALAGALLLIGLVTAGQAQPGPAVACENGRAGAYPCRAIDLLAALPVDAFGDVLVNDLWGWADAATGRAYVVLGLAAGTAFVDVTDPTQPVYLGTLPATAGTRASLWRDVKVHADHAYIVSEAVGHGLQVFDLTQLRAIETPPVTFQATARYDGFGAAHNIVVNEASGFAYVVGIRSGETTCAGGLHMLDLTDPANPKFAGCFSDDGYTHDAQCVIYQGPDADYQGAELCVAANEDALTLVDVTDKTRPYMMARRTYPDVGYVHQGWLTEDHRYFLQGDELDEGRTVANTRTLIWDLTDLDDPRLRTTFLNTTTSIDHNLYVRGPFAYQANYTSGLRILDISNIDAPAEVAFFDTTPANSRISFEGAWSVYPFFASGVVAVSSIEEGLFLLRPDLQPQTQVLDFAARLAGEAVVLTWATGAEVDNAGFRIERRPAGGVFEPVGFVDGRGTTVVRQGYAFEVEGLAPGSYEFRLCQQSTAGIEQCTAAVTIYVVGATYRLSTAHPNPFTREARLTLVVQQPQHVRIVLTDVLGRTVQTVLDRPLAAGVLHPVTIDGTGLAAGPYLCLVTGETFTTARRLVRFR